MSLNPLSLVMDTIAAVTMNPEIAGATAATDAAATGAVDAAGNGLIGSTLMGAAGATPSALAAYGASAGAGAGMLGDVASGGLSALNSVGDAISSVPMTAADATQAATNAANASNLGDVAQNANAIPGQAAVQNPLNGAPSYPQAVDLNAAPPSASAPVQSSAGNAVPGQAAVTPQTPVGPGDIGKAVPMTTMDNITNTFSNTLDKIENWTNQHKFLTQAGLMAAPSIIRGLMGTSTPPVAPKYSGPLSKYHLAGTPGTVGADIAYQPATATPNIYYPHYKKGGLADVESMASGGIASYATGGASNVPTLNPTMYPTSPYISGQNTATNVANAFGRQGMHGGPNDFRNKTTPTPAPVVDPAPTPNTNIYHPSYGTTGLAAASPTQTVAPTINIDSEGNPVFAEGGMVAFGLGGQVNNAYPQSQQEHTQFANPINLPTMAANAQYEPKTDPYSGQMLSMAEGGVAKYATGGNILLEAYYNMTNKKQAAAPRTDVGIYQDSDANTRNLNAFEAAKYRHNALAKYVNAPGLAYNDQASLPQANLNPLVQAQNKAQAAAQPEQELASGGIAGYNLGGYATGGNSRLLKGPGDGMSDNIPATIADRQPARLADGEFVIPADVVSHLGNGSTDAGAKKLHTMMNKVRVARTGKKAQGTQINPNKYLPS